MPELLFLRLEVKIKPFNFSDFYSKQVSEANFRNVERIRKKGENPSFSGNMLVLGKIKFIRGSAGPAISTKWGNMVIENFKECFPLNKFISLQSNTKNSKELLLKNEIKINLTTNKLIN